MHTVQDSPHPNFETCGKQEGCGAGARPFTRSHVVRTVGDRHGDASSGSEDPFSSMGTPIAKVETELQRAQVTARDAPQGHGRGAGGCRARVRALLGLAWLHATGAERCLSSDSRWIAEVRARVRADAAPDSGPAGRRVSLTCCQSDQTRSGLRSGEHSHALMRPCRCRSPPVIVPRAPLPSERSRLRGIGSLR
jgi:hypothetical protein